MKYTFGKPKDKVEKYPKTNIEVPHRYQDILLDGKEIGYLEIHLHRNKKGVSVGITSVVYKDF